ncbi:MAG: 2'-5' RNA ligase family protein [Gammaproteobacteria bacterium]
MINLTPHKNKLTPTHMQSITPKQSTYSLWLRPDQAQINKITKIISELSHRFNSMPFPPHISLLTSISADTTIITKACENIIAHHSVFNIILEQIGYTENYYRNLYILAKLDQPLINIYKAAKHQLNHKTQETFMPHISLHYGKLNGKKQQSLKEKHDEHCPKIFSCRRLDLYCTTNKESEWYLVDSFNLSNNEP